MSAPIQIGAGKWQVQDGRDVVFIWISPAGLCIQKMTFNSAGRSITHDVETIPFSILADSASGQKRFDV